MAGTIPQEGRWIEFRIGSDNEKKNLKAKVISIYSEVEEILIGTHFDVKDIAMVEILHDCGEEDCLELNDLNKYGWKYTEAPSEDDITAKKTERENIHRELSCALCNAKDKKLYRCKACEKVWYCGRECQKADWKAKHSEECKELQRKLKLKPNPRYPLKNSNSDMGIRQMKLQNEYSLILMDALNGRFKIRHQPGFRWEPVTTTGEWINNPSSNDMQALERYGLKYESQKGGSDPISMKWRALESKGHSPNGPSACLFLQEMEIVLLKDERYREGGLHYLAGSLEAPHLFWGMAMNFNTFGTVTPFTTGCHCNFKKIPPKYKTIKRNWDMFFKRAKKNKYDVQCMFADTPVGCHGFGKGCQFRHDILV